MGRRLNGNINEDDLVERVLTWVANPLFGDMIYDHRYTGYQDFGGVMFPTVMPAERILINADIYSPPAPGADPPAVTPNMRSLAHNIEQLGQPEPRGAPEGLHSSARTAARNSIRCAAVMGVAPGADAASVQPGAARLDAPYARPAPPAVPADARA